MQPTTISLIKDQVKTLPPEQKVELIKFLADSLAEQKKRSVTLTFGKYAHLGGHSATEEDFKIAEWHPSDDELNGN